MLLAVETLVRIIITAQVGVGIGHGDDEVYDVGSRTLRDFNRILPA